MSSATARPPRAPALADEAFAALKQVVIARTGHHYYADKDVLLRDRLQRRLEAQTCGDCAEYLALLSDPRRGPAEWRELEAEITIGETFFFRHAEQFAALQETILPALLRENGATRRLRIWSAGCAIGAEPYSLAILVERLLGTALADWTVEIVGSDLNARAIAQAGQGRFTEWAMRGMAPAERQRHFVALPDQRHWVIAERHRRLVRFVQHNLLSLLQPGGASEWRDFDLILCRNVLIYFSPEQTAPMLSTLARSLSPAGWLMVGHSDAIAALPRGLRTVELSGTQVFRLPQVQAAQREPLVPWAPAPWPEQAKPAPVPPAPRACAPPSMAEPAPPPSVTTIRHLADAGQLDQAAVAAAAAIAADPLDPRLHFYDGLVAQAAGDLARAEAALRRAVYLSARMVMAQYHLGLLLLGRGAEEAGARALAEVLRLCAAMPETALLPEGDGLTARDLMTRVRMQLPSRP
ncbi:CheR family methyltransferase [Acidisoma sp. 7E03]